MVYIELQRGKKGMTSAKYNQTLMKTAACTARLIEGTRETNDKPGEIRTEREEKDEIKNKDKTYFADAWFGLVNAVLAATERGSHLVCVVKTNTNRYPKKFLESTMQKWPPGSHLLLQAFIEGKFVYDLGYKYSKKKVICFLFNKGAGHTEDGDPYIAKWKDPHGNTVRRFVKRPDVVAKYFQNSNTVDMHNHARQGELQLEKAWITTDRFFRVATTLFAITVTDSWKAYRHHLHPRHRHKHIGIAEFASLCAKDLLNNKMSREVPNPETMNTTIGVRKHPRAAKTGPRTGTVIRLKPNHLKEVPETEKLTQDSWLSEIDLAESSEETKESDTESKDKGNRKIPPTTHEVHTIILNNEWTTEHKTKTHCNSKRKTSSSKRRKRGKCLYCNDRNTGFYCASCPPSLQSKKHWVCGPPECLSASNNRRHAQCQRAHVRAWKERVRRELDKMTNK